MCIKLPPRRERENAQKVRAQCLKGEGFKQGKGEAQVCDEKMNKEAGYDLRLCLYFRESSWNLKQSCQSSEVQDHMGIATQNRK